MAYGHLLATTLQQFTKEGENYLRGQNIEHVGNTIQGCAVMAGIAGASSGLLPGVGSTIALGVWLTAVWGMYIKINKDLGISIKDNVLKSLASAVLTNIAASAGSIIAALVASAAISFIPGLGNISAVLINGMLGYVVVYASGLLYIRILTKVMKANGNLNLEDVDLKKVAKETVKESDMKNIIKEGKDGFKQAKKNGEIKTK